MSRSAETRHFWGEVRRRGARWQYERLRNEASGSAYREGLSSCEFRAGACGAARAAGGVAEPAACHSPVLPGAAGARAGRSPLFNAENLDRVMRAGRAAGEAHASRAVPR